MKQNVVQIAKKLAKANARYEAAITEIYLFPAEDEIRLVELDPTTLPSGERITPFYFPPDPESGIPIPAGIALILPEEKGRVALPETWGNWSQAVLVYKKKDLAA